MGIYSSNRMSGIGYDVVDYSSMIEADQSYNDVTGCAIACLEAQQNDLALFNATITNDFTEVKYVQEGYSVLNESAAGILDKIKEIFLKLLAKIKGIFKAFLAKLSGVFRSNKSLYDQYKDTISNYHSWKSFKVKKYRKLKSSNDPANAIGNAVQYDIDKMSYSTTMSGLNNELNELLDKNERDILDNEDIAAYLIKDRLKDQKFASNLDNDLNNVTKELMDYVFDDEETKDDWNGSDILNGIIGRVISQGDKIEDNVKKANNNLEKNINNIINALNKEQSKITKAISTKGEYTGVTIGMSTSDSSTNKASLTRSDTYKRGIKAGIGYNDKDNKWYKIDKDGNMTNEEEPNPNPDESKEIKDSNVLEKISKEVGVLQRIASEEQSLITKLTTARLTATKFLISQARRVWSSAAAYASSEHKNESYEYYTAIGEAAVYDFNVEMEAMG